MKPLGKAMKVAHRNDLNKKKALDGFLANYRATPHSSTGIAPGDILLRHGYNKDFPELNLKTDKEIREALDKDMAKRNQRNTNLNEHRLSHNLEVGDLVLTKNNNKKRKFEPTFNEQPMVVSAIENDGGIICSAPNSEQRRHADDIRPLIVSEQSISQPAITSEEQTAHLASNGAYRQEDLDPPDSDNTLRKSSHKRYPNPKQV